METIFDQINQILGFLTNVITILGFLGIGYISYIYKIEVYDKKYITYIGDINIAFPEIDYKNKEKIYQGRKNLTIKLTVKNPYE